jgi:hypothetical protein
MVACKRHRHADLCSVGLKLCVTTGVHIAFMAAQAHQIRISRADGHYAMAAPLILAVSEALLRTARACAVRVYRG